MPLGTIALVVIGIALLGYSAWLLSSAITDSERRGRDAKGLSIRAGEMGSAVIHTFIGVNALRLR